MKPDKILIIGGDTCSIDIVKTAQSMGLYVIVTDWYDTKRSPAKLVADEFWNVSIEDYDTLLRKIKEEKINGILTGFTDSYLIPYQHLCELAGLPCYGTKDQFKSFTDKSLYKQLCLQFGVPTIRSYQAQDSDIQYPVLVKPVDGSGSRGISICNTARDLDFSINEAKASSKQEKYIIEQYIDGREVTIFWLFVNGHYYISAFGNRHVKYFGVQQIPLPVGYTFPSIYTTRYLQETAPHAEKMFKHLGIQNGMLFMQCKVDNGQCLVYDIGYRLTGSFEYKIIEKTCGYNPLKMLIHYAMTGDMLYENGILDKITPLFKQPAFNVSCLCQQGTIKAIEGTSEINAMPNIVSVQIAHFPGDTITKEMLGRLAQITVRVLGVTDTSQELLPTMNHIEQTIQVISSTDENMRMAGITAKDIEGQVI